MDLISTATTTDEATRAARIGVLPVGSFEQHGPHLPLTTDTIIACAIADAHDLLLLPPVTIGCSHEHTGWPGTVSIGSATLTAIVTDVADSLRQAGVDQLVVVNGHGGNYVLSNIVQEANVGQRRMALYPGRHNWETARRAAGRAAGAKRADAREPSPTGFRPFQAQETINAERNAVYRPHTTFDER